MTLGLGTLAYGLAAGALAATAAVFAFIAMQRRRSERPFLALGLFALAMTASTVVTVRLQKSNSIEEYADLLKLFGMVNLLTLVAMVGLVAAWTRAVPRPIIVAFLGASAMIAVLQVVLPEGLLAMEITGLREVRLFGEPFVVHEASSSPWRPALDVYLLATLVLIGAALWQSLRRGPRAEAIVLAVGFTMFIGVAMYDSLVDEGVVDTPYLAPFGAVLVVGVAAWHLARRVASTERRLASQTSELEATVIDRTAALIESNRRLERQLAQQRESARLLATLAEQFESVNALALRNNDLDEIHDELLHVLANLGGLLGVDAVGLYIDGTEPAATLPADVRWNAGRADAHDRDGDGPEANVEPLVMGSRTLGELVVHPAEGRALGEDERRYIELTADHLAGFLDRLELSDRIAATAVDVERHRIARELHDSVTQKLYSIAFLADAVPRQLDLGTERVGETIRRMRELLLASLAELRTLLFELQPEALDGARLSQLVEQLAEMFDSTSRCRIEHEVDTVPELPPFVKLGFYRVAQEALSNAARHSDSEMIEIELADRAGTVELAVRDHGVGFARGAGDGGQGVRNMRERATSMGADLDVESVPGIGTTVTLRWQAGADHTPTAPIDALGAHR